LFNSEKFDLIKKNFDDKINAHSYLFYTNDFLKCKNDVELLIKGIFKNNNLKSLENDYVCINKSDKKNIQKEEILNIKNIIFNTSYINEKRLYLIEEADKLNSSSANMILKFLEEPADNIIALFITTNIDAVLPTIKSRCQIVNVMYNNEYSYDNELVKVLDDYLQKNKYIAIFETKNYFKKYDRTELIKILENYLVYLSLNVLNNENIIMIKKINKVLNLLNNNVNVDYAFDVLFLEGD